MTTQLIGHVRPITPRSAVARHDKILIWGFLKRDPLLISIQREPNILGKPYFDTLARLGPFYRALQGYALQDGRGSNPFNPGLIDRFAPTLSPLKEACRSLQGSTVT